MQSTLIEMGKEYRINNVAAFRKKMRYSDIQKELSLFLEVLKDRNAIKQGPVVTVTFSNEFINGEQVLDMEFLIPIQTPISLSEPYVFKPLFLLTNSLYTRYIGKAELIDSAYKELIDYIAQNKLHQITSVYNVNVNDEKVIYGDDPVIDIYIGINPSVL